MIKQLSGEPLKIFISGNERECDDERAIVKEIVEQLCMKPQASESRGASHLSIKDLNMDRVRNSDLYIGIFGKYDSEPSREEYEEAKKNHIPRLVYVKQLQDDEKRDPEIESFLKEIEDAKYGVTFWKYENACKLRDQAKHDIMVNTISIYYRGGRKKELEVTEKEMKPTLDINLPQTVIGGETFTVSASTVATSSKGFLDLLLIAPDGKRLWFPDPQSWNRELDTGSIQLRKEKYESKWSVTIPSSYPEGEYHAMIGLYDDDPQRRLVAKKEGKISVKKITRTPRKIMNQ